MLSGVSSASLYPLHTEDALRTLGALGVRNAEIFINDFSESEGRIFDEILKVIRDYEMNIISVHPFPPMESGYLFSEYDRRQNSYLEMYKHYFDCMNRLGAEIFVLHGAILSSKCPDERYFEQYSRLLDIADEFGITIAQENICYCKSKDIDFLKRLKENCGGRTKYLLDIKQAVRTGLSPFELIDVLGKDIVHVHISDNSPEGDCLPIGKGSFDFEKLVEKLKGIGYDGALLIELYRHNYGEYSELYECMKKIEQVIANSVKM